MQGQFWKWLATLGTAGLLAACGGGGSDSPASTPVAAGSDNTVAQAVNTEPQLSSLKAMMQFVDEGSSIKLMDELAKPGDMTLMAPSNEALDKVAEEMIGPGKKAADLMKPEYKDAVRDMLKLHMMPGQAIVSTVNTERTLDVGEGTSSVSVSSSSTSSGSGTSSVSTGTGTVTVGTSTTVVTGTSNVSISIIIKVTNGVITIEVSGRPTCTVTVRDIVRGNGTVQIINCVIAPIKPPMPPMANTATIADIAGKVPQLSSLLAAVKFASNDDDLVKLLSGTGTFTVFAPTNHAFDRLAAELLGEGKKATDLLVPENKALVRAVLQYHVLGAVVKKADIPLGKPIDPVLEGSDIFKIDRKMGKLTITDGRNRSARIIATDVKASNGVVHLIDKVILPADKNIVETAVALSTASKPEFTILVAAVTAAELTATLSGPGPFTVFAPTDAAFGKLLKELNVTAEALLADKPLLTKVLTYHVLPAQVLKADVPVGTPVATVQGGTLTISSDFKITDASNRKSQIIATDVLTKNGVIHVIDTVILPK
jgi:uncharacterized surface protein with fasciclin (FAS1) repeats